MLIYDTLSVFRQFPKLMLLFKGRLAYSGKPAHAVDFFERETRVTCEAQINPADYFLHAMAVTSACTPVTINEAFLQTPTYQSELQLMLEREKAQEETFSQDAVQEYARSYFSQVAFDVLTYQLIRSRYGLSSSASLFQTYATRSCSGASLPRH